MADRDRRSADPARDLPFRHRQPLAARAAHLIGQGGGGGLPDVAPAASPVALTFDDGPDPSGTPGVLRELDAIGARATFFVLAPQVLRHPRLLRDTMAAGHEVGLHGFHHVRHSRRSRGAVERDTDVALAALDGMGAAPVRWRTPWGDVAPWTGEVAARRGLTLTGWTADTVDWRGDDAERMLEAVRPALAPGCVVLMHDGLGPGARRSDCAETVRLLRPLAAAVAERGLEIGALPAPVGAAA